MGREDVDMEATVEREGCGEARKKDLEGEVEFEGIPELEGKPVELVVTDMVSEMLND